MVGLGDKKYIRYEPLVSIYLLGLKTGDLFSIIHILDMLEIKDSVDKLYGDSGEHIWYRIVDLGLSDFRIEYYVQQIINGRLRTKRFIFSYIDFGIRFKGDNKTIPDYVIKSILNNPYLYNFLDGRISNFSDYIIK